MPVYHGKLLEFKAIKEESDKTFLQVRLSFEESFEIYLEIDEFTSGNISTLIETDTKYKYRLSFNNYYDTSRNQHISTLTRTYLDYSENMSFPCSEEYVNMLSSIKSTENINDVDKLSFISRNIKPIKEKDQILTKNIENKVNIYKPPQLIFFSLGVIFIMFFSYLNLSSSYDANISREALAESTPSYNEVNTKQDEYLDLNNIILYNDNDDIILEKTLLVEPTIDFIELNQTITYDIPKGNVALTFDDGPSKYTERIVDILKEYEVGGTFFFVGKNIERYIDSVKNVHSKGYSVGSHSINHHNMPTLSYADQEIELIKSIELLKEITNAEINLFRPPYGSYSQHVKDLINKNNYKMVLWNIDPEDWKSRNSDKIFDYIQNSDVSGSIILLHESQAVVDALPKIIEYLHQLDLKIVNLE